jgi:DNA-binding NarL/FixJ family response regulator
MEINNPLVYIADDHVMVAQGFSSLLHEQNITNIRIFSSGKDLYKACLAKMPDMVFSDMYMTDWDGLTTLKEFRKINTHVPFIIISMMGERRIVEDSLNAGANGYLHKSGESEDIKMLLEKLAINEKFISDKIIEIQKHKIQSDQSTYFLTEPISSRELEVLRLLCDGLGYGEIATTLFISQNTVETHKKNLLHKFGVNSVSKMIALAFRHKFIE